MRKDKLLIALKKALFYVPFTWYFVLFATASAAGYLWLRKLSDIPDSAYRDIIVLLLSVALWCSLILLCLGWFSVALAYFYFKIQQRQGRVNLHISVPEAETEREAQTISLKLAPLIKPLLGFIRIRLNYDTHLFSEKFSLISAGSRLLEKRIEGVYHWHLPGIREYKLNRAYIYFEDCFQFFSFAVAVDTHNFFHTRPATTAIPTVKAFPRKTEETHNRIEELRKVEGELLNYKNFESNDDVRRIVWKIYAKNKELVVRIPEILDPYASHIYLYPSFHTTLNVLNSDVVQLHFLNFYKTICWSLYSQLISKGMDVRYIPDQTLPQHSFSTDKERVKYAVTASNWQSGNDLKNYIKPRDASIVLISSLNDVKEVEDLLERYGNDISFVFVPLSASLRSQTFGSWIKWLFVQEEKDAAALYRSKWALATFLRPAIEENEEALSDLLKQYQKSTVLET